MIKDQTRSEVARKNGIHIPALCYHPEVIHQRRLLPGMPCGGPPETEG
ncbi:MAG: hypothetical protein MZU79_09045 [Anaerotruncus sp.]|nr:hypothetical protein [Anaerotruncus sp.]